MQSSEHRGFGEADLLRDLGRRQTAFEVKAADSSRGNGSWNRDEVNKIGYLVRVCPVSGYPHHFRIIMNSGPAERLTGVLCFYGME